MATGGKNAWLAVQAVAILVTLVVGALSLKGLVPVEVVALLLFASLGLNIYLLLERRRAEGSPESAVAGPDAYRYEFLSFRWVYAIDPVDPATWRGVERSIRHITAATELTKIVVNLARSSDSALSFRASDGRVPQHRMISHDRAPEKGKVQLSPAQRSEGTHYSFHIQFVPPLQPGESVRVEYEVVCPQYKFAHREDVIAHSTKAETEVRETEFNRYSTVMRIKEFRYEVVLPESLGAHPAGLRLESSTVDVKQERAAIDRNREYSEILTSIDGESCWVQSLHRKNPSPRVTYFISWRPPARVPAE